MSDFLEQVVAERRADAKRAKARAPILELAARPPRSVRVGKRALAEGRVEGIFATSSPRQARDPFSLMFQHTEGRIAVIAEVKRRSPALGLLSETVDPAAQARAYAAAGASAISVLTEPRHWGGSIEDLVAVALAVDVPVLCKDVIVDDYQIDEACAAGADAILLIAEALDDQTMRRFIGHARTLGIGVLVEAHEPAAFGRAVNSGAHVVGINARNLRSPTDIDIGRVRQLHGFARADQFLVAESGIATVDDARLLPSRVDAVLIGTALMRAEDPAPLIHGIASIRRTAAVR
jgi:indole-3-glycerol phosphate synthase